MTEDNSTDDFNLWQLEIKNIKKIKSLIVKTKPTEVLIQISNKASYDNSNILNKKYEDILINDKRCINNSVWRKINRGRYKIDDSIDLHGLNETQAFASLKSFIIDRYDSDKRLLLIIVGKGNKSENKRGVLRSMLPKWINLPSIRPFILYVSEANYNDGGSGAYYILLKRK